MDNILPQMSGYIETLLQKTDESKTSTNDNERVRNVYNEIFTRRCVAVDVKAAIPPSMAPAGVALPEPKPPKGKVLYDIPDNMIVNRQHHVLRRVERMKPSCGTMTLLAAL